MRGQTVIWTEGFRRFHLRWRWALTSIFLISLAQRLWYLTRLAHSPLDGVLEADSLLYWNWSTELLNHGWLGHQPFFLGPLYPYLLTALRTLGLTLHGILIVQAIWGSLMIVLVADAARRATSAWPALAIGLILSGYSMAIFLDGQVLMESLVLGLEALMLWLITRLHWARPQRGLLITIGLVIGVQAQARVLALASVIPLAVVIWRAAGVRRAALSMTVVTAIALTLAIPTTLRHANLVHEFIPFTYSTGYNYYVGNHEHATGSFTPITDALDFNAADNGSSEGGAFGDGRSFLERTEGRHYGYTGSSRRWLDKALEFASEHPIEEVQLLLRKFLMMLNRREYSQVSNEEVNRALVGPIGWPLLGSFFLVLLLACAGLSWALRDRFGQYCVGHSLAVVAGFASLFVTDRYRVHLIPPLALLASYGLARWMSFPTLSGSSRRWLLVASLAAVVIACLPLPWYSAARRQWNDQAELGRAWLEHDKLDKAAAALHEAILIDESGSLEGESSEAGREGRAGVYGMYGGVLGVLGRGPEALQALLRANSLQPDTRPVLLLLACTYAQLGAEQRAIALWRSLDVSDNAAANMLLTRARALESNGHSELVRPLLITVIHVNRTSEQAWVALARLEMEEGNWLRAERVLTQAARNGISSDVIIAHRAYLAASLNQRAVADSLLRSLPESAGADPAVREMVISVRAYLRSQ